MASLSLSYLINVMSQFGVSILGVSLRHIDVAFLGVSRRHMDVAFLGVSRRFSAFLGVSRHVMGDGGTDVSDAGSFQHFGVRLAMATATWTSATQVRFNSACVVRWRRRDGRQRRRFVSIRRASFKRWRRNVDVSDAGSFQFGVRRSSDGGATSTSVTRY